MDESEIKPDPPAMPVGGDAERPGDTAEVPAREQTRLGSRFHPWRARLLGFLLGIVVTLLLVFLIGGPVAVAHRNDLPLERYYGRFAVNLAARFNAGGQTAPAQGSFGVNAEAGRAAYAGSCASCHGADGKGKGVFGTETYPPATDLTTQDAIGKSDAQLYWIIQNGLSFTGMPGFAKQYDSNGIWSLVSYIRQIQQGRASALSIPTPTADQLAQANINGTAVQRGAAVYFAAGCQYCHGAVGNAPGELGLGRGGGEAQQAIRRGRPGMPTYDTSMISESQLSDLEAYLNTLTGRRRG